MNQHDVKNLQKTAKEMAILLGKLNSSIQLRAEEIKQSKEFKELNLKDSDIDVGAKIAEVNMEINSLNDKINALR